MTLTLTLEKWRPLLKFGMRGEDVRALQRYLIDEEHDVGRAGADGVFGGATHNAVVAWQRARGWRGAEVTGEVGAGEQSAIAIEMAPLTPTLRTPSMSLAALPFREARNWSRNVGPQKKKWIVLHSMEMLEASTTAERCADYFHNQPPHSEQTPGTSAHACVVPGTRILTRDSVWRCIGDLHVGQPLWATEEHSPGPAGRTLQPAVITEWCERSAACARVIMSDGREVTCTIDHKWLAKPPGRSNSWQWVETQHLTQGGYICAPLTPWPAGSDFDAGYMSGLLDGEGCWSECADLSFSQRNNACLVRALGVLAAHGIPYRRFERVPGVGGHPEHWSAVSIVTMSGLNATLHALGRYAPRRLQQEDRLSGRSFRSRTHPSALRIVAVESVGKQDIVSIETSTRTYFAEGMISHNCIDDDSIVQCVPWDRVAWHAPGANQYGIGLEHAGFARQETSQWLDPYGKRMLALSSWLCSELCRLHDIPLRVADPALLLSGEPGITTHAFVTEAWKKSSHTDPGASFPLADYLGLCRRWRGL